MHKNLPPIKETFLRFHFHSPCSDWTPSNVISWSEIAVIHPHCWFPRFQPSDAIAQSHIVMYTCPYFYSLMPSSNPILLSHPKRYRYRKSELSHLPLSHISAFIVSPCLSQNPRFVVKLYFTAKPKFSTYFHLYRKSIALPHYHYIAIT